MPLMGSVLNLLVIRMGVFGKAGFANTDRLPVDFDTEEGRCDFLELLPGLVRRADLRLRLPPLPPPLGYP